MVSPLTCKKGEGVLIEAIEGEVSVGIGLYLKFTFFIFGQHPCKGNRYAGSHFQYRTADAIAWQGFELYVEGGGLSAAELYTFDGAAGIAGFAEFYGIDTRIGHTGIVAAKAITVFCYILRTEQFDFYIAEAGL